MVILIYVLKIPKEITELTVQEFKIMNIVWICMYILFGIVTILNVIHYFIDSRNGLRKTGYLIAVFAVSFIFIKEWPIAIFSMLGTLIIIVGTLRERWIETNSFTAISIIVLLIVLSIGIIGSCFIYKSFGIYIRDKENKNELAYKQDYFKYITEIGIDEPYINIKKDGKFGYINTKGETVINFEFDYASPFVPITMYDKNFDIALVCKDGSTWIILKNLRKVLSYRTESMDQDYEKKLEELKNIYYNVLEQKSEMTYEIEIKEVNNNLKIEKYPETSEEYTYKYNYNEEYDIIVTESNMGLKNTYELAKKDLSLRIALDCESLCYDENYLYIYSNGSIPFYDINKKQQGWFTKYGVKVPLKGNAQILEIINDYILIKNHNDNTIYFIDSNGTMVSEIYKEIFIVSKDKFIVKNKNNKYTIINSNFEKLIDGEWDFVDTSLLSNGLYIFGETKGVIEFNDYNYAENIKMKVLNEDGKVIVDNVEQIYLKYYNISSDKSKAYSSRYSEFLNNLKVMKYDFIGDKFYK